MKTKIDADKVLDELMKASSSCIEVFGEKEELDEMSVNEVKNELEMRCKSDQKTYSVCKRVCTFRYVLGICMRYHRGRSSDVGMCYISLRGAVSVREGDQDLFRETAGGI